MVTSEFPPRNRTRRQFLAMQDRGIPPKCIYLDKMSGKDFQRTGYQKLIKKLKKGDLLVIKSIDRLGRNYSEILEQWRRITREIGADIEVLDMPLFSAGVYIPVGGILPAAYNNGNLPAVPL